MAHSCRGALRNMRPFAEELRPLPASGNNSTGYFAPSSPPSRVLTLPMTACPPS
jgi:hypothetical protein